MLRRNIQSHIQGQVVVLAATYNHQSPNCNLIAPSRITADLLTYSALIKQHTTANSQLSRLTDQPQIILLVIHLQELFLSS